MSFGHVGLHEALLSDDASADSRMPSNFATAVDNDINNVLKVFKIGLGCYKFSLGAVIVPLHGFVESMGEVLLSLELIGHAFQGCEQPEAIPCC